MGVGTSQEPTIAQVEGRMNEAEKYVLVSCQYNTGSLADMDKDLMAEAVNTHDLKKLKEVVNKIPWANVATDSKNGRAKVINALLDRCKTKLYHNVD